MPASGADRIGALPDEILHPLLSFLPAQQSVRTCVLAQRWRHLWRFTTGPRVVGVDRPGPIQELQMVMHHLLVLRGRTDLDTFKVEFRELSPEEQPDVSLWVRFAMLCRARALTGSSPP